MSKKQIRSEFRKAVFKRDGYRCRHCGKLGKCRQTGEFEGPNVERVNLDAHHIIERNLFENGGYVKENGVSLCDDCHAKAEVFHSTGIALLEFHPDDLYKLIGSTPEKAAIADKKLASKAK